MQKSSNSDYDGQIYQTVPLKLGKLGLDLRTDDTSLDSLADLRNARFSDEEIVERRTGHVGKLVQDQSTFITGNGALGDWVYGHGNVVSEAGNAVGVHYPISRQHLYTFNYGGNDVSWTGDRLLIHTPLSNKCLGNSSYWTNPLNLGIQQYKGIPCFLPSLVDYTPPIKVPTDTYNSCDCVVSDTARCILYTVNGAATAQVIDRFTNQIINISTLSSTNTNNSVRLISSAGQFIAYWLDTTTTTIYKASWNGTQWTGQSTVATANVYDIETTGGDFYYLVYRSGSVIKARAYVGSSIQPSPFAIDTVIDTTGTVPVGPVGIAVKPTGNFGVVWFSNTTNIGCIGREYSAQLTTIASKPLLVLDSNISGVDSVAICANKIPDLSGNTYFTTYIGYVGGTNGLRCVSFSGFVNNGPLRYGCTLASRAFRVGNEVFVWVRSGNTALHFLLSGVAITRVSGYADRGEAGVPNPVTNRTLVGVTVDPLNRYKFTWARPITATVTQANHVRYSDIDFLPQVTSAQYGNSVYLSGSAVVNFDGYECSDAGFQEYPITVTGVASAGGSLSAGNYQIRAYLVRYNNRGERFISPAKTSASIAAAGSQKITWTITTVQSCNCTDGIIEVYRTQANGTAFNLEGTIANDQTQYSVSFVSTASDATIASAVGDAYQAQLGGLAELQNWGPIGCTTLVATNDRLWGAGGQVPFGRVEFSKLKIDLFGACFDAIGGFSTVDSEGGAVTSIGNISNQVIVFEADKFFAIDSSEGPDNFGRGGFPAAKFAAAKGAINHFGTILTDAGLVYWNEGGPHLISSQFTVTNISDPIRPLATTLIPTGVRLNPNKQEVIWYTNTGTALLWDYKYKSRWALWTGLYVNAASETALATDTLLLTDDTSVYTDAGAHYTFSLKTNQLRAEMLMQGYPLLQKYGLTGTYQGEHTTDIRIYYNGSPLWEEYETWSPEIDTYLQPASTFGDLTAAQVDALLALDKSGNYAMHRRAKRQNCQRFQVEILDSAPDGPSFIPQTLEFTLGARPGFGRSPVTTFTDK